MGSKLSNKHMNSFNVEDAGDSKSALMEMFFYSPTQLQIKVI